ncbi:hypothetical protein GGR57DRAFT_474310 [Xylariaceae sp. FL1272]|nr:hypothetical protein GGR57DRAFT_474310 [Xylariaceae sp. FL1272]
MLSTLPTELIQEVLEHVGDIKSLAAATLTCHAVRDAFTGAKDIILINTLRRLIHPSIFPEVLARSEAVPFGRYPRQLDFQNNEDVASVAGDIEKFLTNLYTTKPPKCWTVSKAVSICKFHNIVEHFSAQFLEEWLPRAEVRLGNWEPTVTEIRRVHLALYRYDIWCHLFAIRFDYLDDSVRDFFSHYANWEIEQMVCIADMLFNAVEKPFNEFAANYSQSLNDELQLPCLTRHSEHSDRILGLGVEFLYMLAKADNFEEQSQLLKPNFQSTNNDDDEPQTDDLEDSISWLWVWDSLSGEIFPEWGEKQRTNIEKRHVGTSHNDELDNGPADAWKHANPEMRYFIHTSYHLSFGYAPEIEWGYVFWDKARLMSTGLLRMRRRDFNNEDTLWSSRHPVQSKPRESFW